jgi:hypothetical protein
MIRHYSRKAHPDKCHPVNTSHAESNVKAQHVHKKEHVLNTTAVERHSENAAVDKAIPRPELMHENTEKPSTHHNPVASEALTPRSRAKVGAETHQEEPVASEALTPRSRVKHSVERNVASQHSAAPMTHSLGTNDVHLIEQSKLRQDEGVLTAVENMKLQNHNEPGDVEEGVSICTSLSKRSLMHQCSVKPKGRDCRSAGGLFALDVLPVPPVPQCASSEWSSRSVENAAALSSSDLMVWG